MGGLEWLLIGALGVWRVTHLLHAELGPWNVLERLRSLLDRGRAGRLLACFYCLSLWVAAPFAVLIGRDWSERGLLVLAFSGAAILLERATAPAEGRLATRYWEEEEESHVLLPPSPGRADAALAEPADR